MKLKSIKAVNKRIKITKNDKIIVRKAGQDHFNARENSKTKRAKRSDITLTNKKDIKNIKLLIPNK